MTSLCERDNWIEPRLESKLPLTFTKLLGLGQMGTGWIADHYTQASASLLPMLCFGIIACYGFAWKGLFARDMIRRPSRH